VAFLPQSVLEFLKGKRELGIHTEMFTDAIIDLIESGAITGEHKSIDKNKVVASFCSKISLCSNRRGFREVFLLTIEHRDAFHSRFAMVN